MTRGVLTLCTCGATCVSGRCPDCEPSELARVVLAATRLAGPEGSPRVTTVTLPAGSQLARVAVLAALLGGDRRAVRDAAWLVRGGAA